MVGRPGAAYNQLAVLQLFCRSGVPVLIFFHRLGINQVGNIDQHPVRGYLLTANFLVQGVEELVDLDGKGTGLGLAFSLPRRLLSKFNEIFAADGIITTQYLAGHVLLQLRWWHGREKRFSCVLLSNVPRAAMRHATKKSPLG